MDRRDFLKLLSSAATAAVASSSRAPTASAGKGRIRAICFDLFTLFDPLSIVPVARSYVGEKAVALCDAWRVRQFEYSWLRACAGRYVDFEAVTDDALAYALRASKLELGREERRKLVTAYSELALWPDAKEALTAWKEAGLKLAPLANFSPPMIDRLLQHGGIGDLFHDRISTDRARTYKPDPRAYALGTSALRLPKEEIAFAAFGPWDAAGAAWFGFPTFWVNRLGVPEEELGVHAYGVGRSLADLDAFVRRE